MPAVTGRRVINHEDLRVPADRPADSPHTDPDPSAPTRQRQAGGAAESTEEEVGGVSREEPLLLRRTGDRGPAERGPAPHPGPDPGHEWIILHI